MTQQYETVVVTLGPAAGDDERCLTLNLEFYAQFDKRVIVGHARAENAEDALVLYRVGHIDVPATNQRPALKLNFVSCLNNVLDFHASIIQEPTLKTYQNNPPKLLITNDKYRVVVQQEDTYERGSRKMQQRITLEEQRKDALGQDAWYHADNVVVQDSRDRENVEVEQRILVMMLRKITELEVDPEPEHAPKPADHDVVLHNLQQASELITELLTYTERVIKGNPSATAQEHHLLNALHSVHDRLNDFVNPEPATQRTDDSDRDVYPPGV